MAINVLDHCFVSHKSEEMICWSCGYVIWRCDNAEEVIQAMIDIGNVRIRCGKAWHRTIPVDASGNDLARDEI